MQQARTGTTSHLRDRLPTSAGGWIMLFFRGLGLAAVGGMIAYGVIMVGILSLLSYLVR